MSTTNIAVVVGSLRKDSFNKKLASALEKLFPADFSFTTSAPQAAPSEDNFQGLMDVSGRSASVPVKICGWVKGGLSDSFKIIDNNINPLLLSRNEVVRTSGHFDELKNMECACVTGQMTQVPSGNNSHQVFLNVSKVESNGKRCSDDQSIAKLKPKIAHSTSSEGFKSEGTFCGWVSVDSRTQNITIVDNRIAPTILASSATTPVTVGDYRSLYKSQCGCVTGKVAETVNGALRLNYFTDVENVQLKTQGDCVGLRWK